MHSSNPSAQAESAMYSNLRTLMFHSSILSDLPWSWCSASTKVPRIGIGLPPRSHLYVGSLARWVVDSSTQAPNQVDRETQNRASLAIAEKELSPILPTYLLKSRYRRLCPACQDHLNKMYSIWDIGTLGCCKL